jgi:1-acyl-sn-glycerol-3-phosphate acyltransferase
MSKFLTYVYDVRKIPGESLEQISAYVKGEYPILNRLVKATQTFEMLQRAEENASKKGWGYACQKALEELGVNYEVRGEENIPSTGPLLFPFNHPYGILEGMVVGAGLFPIFEKKGRNLRILGAPQLGIIKGIDNLVSFVDASKKRDYISSLKLPIEHLENNGDLAMCPAGAVSGAGLEECSWKSGIFYLASKSKAVVPMSISGPDHSRMYNLLSEFELTRRLRNVLMMRETWNKKGKNLVLNIGNPISTEVLREIGNRREVVQYLKERCGDLRVAA